VPDASIYTLSGLGHKLPQVILSHLPDGEHCSIVIKPNWVLHQESRDFPIEALVTSTDLIDAVVRACLEKYPDAERITVGDVPLQSCDWEALIRQTGVIRLMEKYTHKQKPAVRFLDLRREKVARRNGYITEARDGEFGDPLGYREIQLGSDSYLDALDDSRNRFRVSDFDPKLTRDSHGPGTHSYLISGTVLEADLVINLPKMKTHQKAGITGALKNLVGINGQKANLVHYRQGTPRTGGDEFPPDVPLPVRMQSRMREILQGRSRPAFALGRAAWNVIRRARGIETRGTRKNLDRTFYSACGAWYGNDTIWRMIYDLNRIVLHAPPAGKALKPTPQRDYLAILDAGIAGEGNGPLQPLPVETDRIVISRDPFVMDFIAARMMGFDPRRIPQLAHRKDFAGGTWGEFTPERLEVNIDGRACTGLESIPVASEFLPPPGWRSHIEAEGQRYKRAQ